MLTLTYGDLRKVQFVRAALKLANCSQLKSPKLAYQIAKIHRRLQDESKIADELYMAKVEAPFVERDEKGNAVLVGDEPKVKEGLKVEYDVALRDLHSIEFTIDQPKIQLNDALMAVNLSPLDIAALDSILELEELKPECKPSHLKPVP